MEISAPKREQKRKELCKNWKKFDNLINYHKL